jgi:GTP-binding protein HflX
MWNHLSRLKMGIGMRGPGEKQLEVDRRLVEKRIADLRADLKAIERRKEREVAARSDRMTVSLVGYTNAGKSTLLNRLTGAGVLTENKLFATLDTRTRRWQLPGWGPVLLSDTVGFIRDLPHHLIESFKATLEESRQADLLLHVADASHPRVTEQMAAVNGVLEDLGCAQKDQLLLLNKIDRITDPSVRTVLAGKFPQAIFVSAATGENAEQAISAVQERVAGKQMTVELEADCADGRLMHFLQRFARPGAETTYEGRNARMSIRIGQRQLEELRQFGKSVRLLQAT